MDAIAGAPTLLFVFNAEGGLIDRIVRSLWKKVRPQSESCSLSRLAMGSVGQLPAWRAFVRSLDLPVSYLYREEFRSHHQAMEGIELPAAFIEYEDGSLELALDSRAIGACKTVSDLAHRVRDCLADRARLTAALPPL